MIQSVQRLRAALLARLGSLGSIVWSALSSPLNASDHGSRLSALGGRPGTAA